MSRLFNVQLNCKSILSEVFLSFPNSIVRIPDGETGIRQHFAYWQRAVFDKSPFVFNDAGHPTVATVERNTPITLNPVGYDDFALSSYREFCELRELGVIPPGVRFQVCLPTPINVISGHVRPEYQAEVEVLYEKALWKPAKDSRHYP
jgi:hypothetical protein